MGNNKGSITINFLFAFVLVMGFSALLFALSLTLMMAEVTQYVTFASARNFFAGHINEPAQRVLASAKYNQLIGHPVLRPLYTNGWFEIQAIPTIGDITQLKSDIAPARSPYMYFGTGTDFIARMLDFEIPFFGSTAPDGDGQGSGFKAFIASYLGREVTVNECLNYTAQRWEAIKGLDESYANGNYVTVNPYVTLDDNGC